jgi:hypothetical protein
VGGAQKFLDESHKLIHAHGAKGLQNLFMTRNYKEAIKLLTDPNEKLPFSFADSARAVMQQGSKAESWQQQLAQAGASRQFEKSLHDVLAAMAQSHDQATALLDEIETKQGNINKFLGAVTTDATTVQGNAQKLQQSAEPDKLFATPSVTENLLPMIGDQTKQGTALAAHDPVRAWDDYATPAKRMTDDAGEIVNIGVDARTHLMPTIADGDKALSDNGVKTDWMHTTAKDISDSLDHAANTAMRTSVADELPTIQQNIQLLETRVTTAVSQDKQRREVSPKTIADAESDVDTGRNEIAAQLQKMGAFKGGTPDQVMREPKMDPTDYTKAAHGNLDAVKPALDVGDTDKAGTLLGNVDTNAQGAHQIVKATRDALAAYPDTLAEREGRTQSTGASIAKTYQPSLDRIKQTYAPEVLGLVVGEAMQAVDPNLKPNASLDQNIGSAQQYIAEAQTQTQSAQTNFDKAYLLTSHQELEAADTALKNAQAELDGVTKAESILGDRQKQVESDLSSLQQRMAQTQQNAGQNFVRDQAQQLAGQAGQGTQAAAGEVGKQPKNPYASAQSIEQAENLRQQAEAAIAADRAAYDQARRAIADAQGDIGSASAAVAAAAAQTWSWSNGQGSAYRGVEAGELMTANAQIAQATATLQRAQQLLEQKQYEAAESTANEAGNEAGQARGSASAAVAAAEADFEAQCARLRMLQQQEDDRRRREEEERQAAARRAAEASSSFSSGSSGGSWGGGGSGSTGGSW